MGGELRIRVFFILSVILVLSTSDGSLLLNVKGGTAGSLGQRRMVVGSRPPGCVNKCLSCRPCIATLVITGRKKFAQERGFRASARTQSSDGDDHGGYYLLSWKCRCGDKIFQP
ncbi:EPIDERMAL PATTERNING FACTOR-like protein 8 [Punica granatum]|uniref:Epidermal patterning factor-like protein n=2 Tax=Punica granatum TaxID=22663 RepID=A0A218X0M3_PUNGR|nr:EPIDERMAL PATTERNING FACTOR-like protein 8 [Punica granatum]OWM78279.1 hypothetical protein CDL15_Pgr015098 [Punica granatum]PKI37468.1 hypothetical protein CRG98_042130 [Punica granatum]